MEDAFLTYRDELENNSEVRELISKQVREIEVIQREIVSLLQLGCNQAEDAQYMKTLNTKVNALFTTIHPHFLKISNYLQDSHSEAYAGIWQSQVSKLVFSAAFMHWLATRDLISFDDAQVILGLGDKIPLRLMDYLLGLCSLPGELSRLCQSLVIRGEYRIPHEIAQFVKQLHCAFQTLNLRNDLLRKRFDSMKYDCQRIESVLYDLAIRKLGENDSQCDNK